MKIILLSIVLALITASSYQSKMKVKDIMQDEEILNYYGYPVDKLITAVDTTYRVWFLLGKYKQGLQGVNFIYPYDDSTDVSMKIYIEEFQFVDPTGKKEFFNMQKFLKEKISRIDVKIIPRLTEDMIQKHSEIFKDLEKEYYQERGGK